MSGLPYQVALDDSLVLSNAQGVIEISSSMMMEQRYPANSQSLSQVQFQNIKLSGSNSLFDSQCFLEYDITVNASLVEGQFLPGLRFVSGANVAVMTISADNGLEPVLTSTGGGTTFSTNIPNLCFRQLPLSRITNSLSIALNNANSQNYNLQQELALHDVLDEDSKDRLAGLCAVDNAKSTIIPDYYTLVTPADATGQLALTINDAYKGGVKQPNNPFWNGGRNNIAVKSVSAVSAAGLYSAVYTIREPLLADPFTVGHSGPALCNIGSLSVTYNIDSSALLQGMFCATKQFYSATATRPKVDGLAVASIANSTLLMRTYAVDPSVVNIPPVMYYDFNYYQFNQTACPNTVGADQTQTTTSISLSTVPKLYVAKIQGLPNGLTGTSTQIGSLVKQITVYYGTYTSMIFNESQLYEAFKRNTKVMKTFSEWREDCEILINPALDIVNNAQSFTGIANSAGLTFSVQYTFNNANQIANGQSVGSLFINEMFIYAGNIANGQGQSVYSTTTISAGQLISALDKPLVSNKALHNAHGLRAGSLFSSIGNVLRGAVSALPGVVNTVANVSNMAQGALNHPVVQSALGALGGGQLMYSSRRGRR